MQSKVFSSLVDIVSILNPAVGVVSTLASNALSSLSSSSDSELNSFIGLEKIADILLQIHDGKVSADSLIAIADELKTISKSITNFSKIVS